MEDKYNEDYVTNEYETVLFYNDRVFLINSEEESSDNELVSLNPEIFIDKNSNELSAMYNDTSMDNLCTRASYSDFCEYIVYCKSYGNNFTDILTWLEEAPHYAFKMYNNRKPSRREFAAHYIHEILDLYCYLHRNYDYNLGLVIDFIDYCYIYSDHLLV